jgi:hypothetical protein
MYILFPEDLNKPVINNKNNLDRMHHDKFIQYQG